MSFAPVRLGNTVLEAETAAADRKSCRRFGPCGVGEKALYLNDLLIDRHFYVGFGSVRRVFKRVAMSQGGFSGKGAFGSIPYLVVQYDDGQEKQCTFKREEDVDELLAYLAGNIDFIERYLKTQIPQVRFQRPEGTYLLWLDFRALGLSDEELEHFLGHRAKIWLIQGAAFGEGGSGFARLNAACPRSVLEEAMDRLNNAVKSL